MLNKIILATQVNSLARYSKRTVQLLRAVPHYSYQVSGSFNFRLRVLFNIPSWYYFAIGLKLYLRLEVDASYIPIQYPMNSTQDTAQILLSYLYEAITLFSLPFQESSSFLKRIYVSSL